VKEIRQARRVQVPSRHGLLEGAPRLLIMMAIREATVPDEGGDLSKTVLQVILTVQGQAEAAYPGESMR